jgi:hypothetical protein
MADSFIDVLKGYENLADRIKNEDPSLLLETDSTVDSPKDINKNGLMSKQAKQFANVSKYYDRSQLQALSLAASQAEIEAARDKPFKGPDDFTKLTGDFDLKKLKTDPSNVFPINPDLDAPNPFTGEVIVEGERNKLHASIYGELKLNKSITAGLFGTKGTTRTKYSDGVIVDQLDREVGAVIKGQVVLSDEAVIYGGASQKKTKSKQEFLTYESKNYGKLSVIEAGAVIGGLDANITKTISNGNKYTKGKMTYRWDGQSLSARADTQGKFGIDYEIKF